MTVEQIKQNFSHGEKKNLIFDLVGVVFCFDKISIVKQIGWFTFIRYAFTVGENPAKRLKKVLVTFLNAVSDNSFHSKAQFEHILLPEIIVALQLGEISEQQVLEKIDHALLSPPKNIFKNELEKSLISLILHTVLDSKLLAEKILKPIKKSIDLLQVFYDSSLNNESTCKLYAFSNMHLTLYSALCKKYPNIFELFNGVIISAQAKHLKPEPDAFRYFLDFYKLNSASCIFFDDQEENVQGACAVGIEAILFERT